MVARLRVSTSGTGAVSDDYANGAPTAGTALLSGGAGAPPTWGTIVGVAPIAQTLVVDGTNFSATPTGTLGAPYQTIQQAINRAVVLGWTFVQVLLAPGTYADPVAIPNGMAVTFHGWDLEAPTLMGGDITITGGVGSFDLIAFSNIQVSAANIATAAPNQDIGLQFHNCMNGAIVRGFNVYIWLDETSQDNNVVAGGGTFISYDGYSWARTLQSNPVLPAGYTRQFVDAGHDIYARALTINGLAIGATGFVTMAVSTGVFVRTADHASVKVVDPAIQDFICGVHGVGAGTVTCWITNLSRVSTNFNEAIELLIHHNDMIAEPAP